MFKSPDINDFKRLLEGVLDSARTKVKRAVTEAEDKFYAMGQGNNSRFLVSVEAAMYPVHSAAVADAMRMLVQFAEKTMWSIDELINLAHQPLIQFNEFCVECVCGKRDRNYLAGFLLEMRDSLRKTVETAEHDLKVGFIEGKTAPVTDSPNSQTRALRLLEAVYDVTKNRDQPVGVDELAEQTGLTEHEAQAAWRYLRDRGLIETFGLQYTARVSTAGIDAIESARREPNRPTTNFPSVTYNIVNTVTVGTAINSPMQQAGTGSTQHATVYSQNDLSGLEDALKRLSENLGTLGLDPVQTRKANAQIATLEAQLSDEPDPVILKQAGKTLRNITEGAIAGLIAAGVQPTLWPMIADIFSRLF